MPSPHAALSSLLDAKRVVITVGAGGVGKTTTAAALGVAAALRGKRVLCLTIDPAKRLAESLGLERMTSEATRVDPAPFAAAGAPLRGELTVMMLDTKRTFDELVTRYSSSPEKAQHLLDNKLYQYVSTQLAGTQEYMAMEKLVAVRGDPRYDLVLLDTPPTTDALDFLDAPERLIDALDSGSMRWFLDAFESTGKLSFHLLARSASVVLRGIGRLVGGDFLRAMAELITAMNDLFGGFKKRASAVKDALRSPDVSFVLVTSPSPASIREALYFEERLAEAKMPRGAFVVNRVRKAPEPLAPIAEPDVARVLADRGVRMDPGAPARVLRAQADASKLAALDALHLRSLYDRVGADLPVVEVPELARDIHDARGLLRLATLLVG